MKVPFLDLQSHHRPHREEFERAIAEVIDSSAFAGGCIVAKFEQEFADYCGSRFAVAVSSGTDALWLALAAAGVGRGDEVITAPNSFIATAEAISRCGATPVFVDVDEDNYNMDPALLGDAITERTKAIVPVHLFGQTADMGPILEIARSHNLPVIEDAAQAHGAKCGGRLAGSMGLAGCFSFYPGKNLGAFGEAGAVVTDDEGVADTIRTFRDHGQSEKYHHKLVGWNCRMDGIQGAVLSVKLRYIDACNKRRRGHAAHYDEALRSSELIAVPRTSPDLKHVYHVYAVRVANRDEVLTAMGEAGIGCGIHYPKPIHLQEAYAELGHQEGAFPVAERSASEFLSLPMFPELTTEQIEMTTRSLTEIVGCSQEATAS